LSPGQSIWIPKDTDLEYGGENALVVIAIAPVNWRQLIAEEAWIPDCRLIRTDGPGI
jgi:ethanolamine utilization protein EutQ